MAEKLKEGLKEIENDKQEREKEKVNKRKENKEKEVEKEKKRDRKLIKSLEIRNKVVNRDLVKEKIKLFTPGAENSLRKELRDASRSEKEMNIEKELIQD